MRLVHMDPHAVIESNCPHCGEMGVRALWTRIAILLNEQPILSSQQSPSSSYAKPQKTKSRRPGVETGRSVGEHILVEFVNAGFHPPSGAKDLVSFGAPDEDSEESHVNRGI